MQNIAKSFSYQSKTDWMSKHYLQDFLKCRLIITIRLNPMLVKRDGEMTPWLKAPPAALGEDLGLIPSTQSSQTSVAPVPGDPTPSSDLQGTCTHVHILKHRSTHVHIILKIK